MSFFKNVSLADYDLTDKGVSQACYDDMLKENPSLFDVLTYEQLRVLADAKREEFKDYMRPLFA